MVGDAWRPVRPRRLAIHPGSRRATGQEAGVAPLRGCAASDALTRRNQREVALGRIALGKSPRSSQESTREWTGWMPMAQGFRTKSPRIHRHPPLENTPHWTAPLPRIHMRFKWRGPMSIIMRGTLQDRAPNTYYG